MSDKVYDFPVWSTQGGGLVKEIGTNLYQFIEKPEHSDFEVGDYMPLGWDVTPANIHAQALVDEGYLQLDLDMGMLVRVEDEPHG